jgi:hypothetical protein
MSQIRVRLGWQIETVTPRSSRTNRPKIADGIEIPKGYNYITIRDRNPAWEGERKKGIKVPMWRESLLVFNEALSLEEATQIDGKLDELYGEIWASLSPRFIPWSLRNNMSKEKVYLLMYMQDPTKFDMPVSSEFKQALLKTIGA